VAGITIAFFTHSPTSVPATRNDCKLLLCGHVWSWVSPPFSAGTATRYPVSASIQIPVSLSSVTTKGAGLGLDAVRSPLPVHGPELMRQNVRSWRKLTLPAPIGDRGTDRRHGMERGRATRRRPLDSLPASPAQGRGNVRALLAWYRPAGSERCSLADRRSGSLDQGRRVQQLCGVEPVLGGQCSLILTIIAAPVMSRSV
jgi:hypothetical protein